ncbi:HAD family hydrolase [Mucilaginibacter sp. KACC 22063]|uniref:HAD family hydrolase n=1 Tax=Mucilaginibacter sp. KACC 22063 TaxID=3025666 RepID=UPI002366B67F|nr:HAD family phosphatase [Mucilaginibacter sp. KACC 22063]WDF54629.1 HAD family phosphatase [Mucilaginibacter sp. KACC 22063]
MKKIAAIFDMDGTLIDNNAYHFKAWQQLFKLKGLPELTHEVFNENMSGVPGLASLHNVLGYNHSDEEFQQWFAEKSELYKQAYAPYVQPINGLERFLTELKDAGIPMAVATSASPGNVEYVFSHLNLRPYFNAIIDGTRVNEAKPNPQIFLKAAHDLGIDPENCIVFEDSISGVKAGNNAGMKVVALTTTHHAGELHPVNMIIADYSSIALHDVLALFEE